MRAIKWRIAVFIIGVISESELRAGPILSGVTETSGCDVEILQPTTLTPAPSLPAETPLPKACTDFSGKWIGGCFDAVVACEKVGPTGECLYTADSILPKNAWTDADLSGAPDLGERFTMTIRQTACKEL